MRWIGFADATALNPDSWREIDVLLDLRFFSPVWVTLFGKVFGRFRAFWYARVERFCFFYSFGSGSLQNLKIGAATQGAAAPLGRPDAAEQCRRGRAVWSSGAGGRRCGRRRHGALAPVCGLAASGISIGFHRDRPPNPSQPPHAGMGQETAFHFGLLHCFSPSCCISNSRALWLEIKSVNEIGCIWTCILVGIWFDYIWQSQWLSLPLCIRCGAGMETNILPRVIVAAACWWCMEGGVWRKEKQN